MFKRILFVILSILTLVPYATAQDDSANAPLVLPPLFDYPVAPEDLEWNERSNWLAEHFWDNFNFKQKSVGQSQLVHAFRTYVVPLHLADRDKALQSVDALIKKLNKQPALLYQFTQAAERTIYEPSMAELMIDEVYLKFLKALVANKKIDNLRKARYKSQLHSLESSMLNATMPSFTFINRSGETSSYTNTGVPTIIEFGDYDCTDCRMARLRLETDFDLQKLVDEGKARICFISPDIDAEEFASWAEGVKDYSQSWTVGMAEGLEDEIDLRTSPALYLIDANGVIISKNASPDNAREFIKKEIEKNMSGE